MPRYVLIVHFLATLDDSMHEYSLAFIVLLAQVGVNDRKAHESTSIFGDSTVNSVGLQRGNMVDPKFAPSLSALYVSGFSPGERKQTLSRTERIRGHNAHQKYKGITTSSSALARSGASKWEAGLRTPSKKYVFMSKTLYRP